jgi:hypothetical protein
MENFMLDIFIDEKKLLFIVEANEKGKTISMEIESSNFILMRISQYSIGINLFGAI